jgi:hypothetical protein
MSQARRCKRRINAKCMWYLNIKVELTFPQLDDVGLWKDISQEHCSMRKVKKSKLGSYMVSNVLHDSFVSCQLCLVRILKYFDGDGETVKRESSGNLPKGSLDERTRGSTSISQRGQVPHGTWRDKLVGRPLRSDLLFHQPDTIPFKRWRRMQVGVLEDVCTRYNHDQLPILNHPGVRLRKNSSTILGDCRGMASLNHHST